MSDGRDQAIKLFGTKIPLLEEQRAAEGDAEDLAPSIDLPLEREKEAKLNTEAAESMMAEQKDTLNSSSLSNPTKYDSITSATVAPKSAEEPKPEHDHKESTHSGEDKALKKPDKILPCPRCDSMDTKFCYYNNYNVNQPRHFCKNCQRYWTAGGTMRNVPVGAGRRKNKHSPSSYRHPISAPDALASAQMDGPDLTAPKRSAKGASTILKFGPDAPLCESVTSLLNLGEPKQSSDFVAENREEASCSPSAAVSRPEEHGFPWPHWPYPWSNDILPSPMIPVPSFCAPTPFPFVPASFWGWSGGPWNLSWAGNFNGVSSPSSSTSTGNYSPTLGKHSREAERSLWVPKTLRIDDPDEAAKSSIFATLGIKLDGCCKFKAFQSNAGRRDASDAAKLLRSNPAALSRSQSFQETT